MNEDAGNKQGDGAATQLSGLPPGKIRFVDHFIPSLRDGDYRITVSHHLSGGTAKGSSADGKEKYELPGENKEREYGASQRFTVRGPRFTLPDADVHSESPPAGHQGRFEDQLPHIVFSKRGLPWERALDSSKADGSVPWLALLVLRADELLVLPASQVKTGNEGVPEPEGLANPARAGKFVVDQVIAGEGISPGPPADTRGPALGVAQLSSDELKSKDQLLCRAIDISTKTFEDVVPRLSEAVHLAHVRQVDTGDKEILGIKDDGWFSVVVGKRFPEHDPDFPAKPAHLPGTTPYVAHLVSLEGFEDLLGDGEPQWPEGVEKVRLISLASWNFNILPEPAESFADLMCGLIRPLGAGLDDLLLRTPMAAGEERREASDATAIDARASAVGRLDRGYLPLSYQTRPGERSFAWYRGPLVPETVPFFLDATGDESGRVPAPTRAAEAYIYDPQSGVFDLSYGVAFMTGRSLALADAVFAQSVMNWRRRMHQILDLVHARITAEHLQGLTASDGDLTRIAAHELEELLEERLLTRAFVRKLVGELGEKVLPGGTPAPPRTNPWQPPVGKSDATVRQQLAQVLAEPAVRSLLAGLPEALPEEIILWLGQRMLLEGVPFSNLVPAARMLPLESIRFFHVDRNWLSCLIDGAFSVGTHCSRDTALYEILRGPIFAGVYEIVHRLRDRLRKVEDATTSSASAPLAAPAQMSGFLLRSAVVSGWPGLEVKAFSGANGTGSEIRLLRMERLSSDVLLVLFPEVPRCVQLNEPRESLGFGYEMIRPGGCAGKPQRKHPDKDAFELRQISGDQAGHPLVQADGALPRTVELAWSNTDKRVLNVNEMVARIAEAIGVQPETIGPAAFALNMVKVPEQMLFEHPEEAK